MNDFNNSSQIRTEEMVMANAWASMLTDIKTQLVSEDVIEAERHSTSVPFSFMCGTTPSRDWLHLKNASIESSKWQDGKRLHFLCWHDIETSICCTMELTEFSDFPAMEWIIRLRNDGHTETAPISNFKALDIFWNSAKKGEIPELRRALGSDGRHDDFSYIKDELRQSMWDRSRTVRMDYANNTAFRKSRNGSPAFLENDSRTSATWLPFFNLRTGDDGIVCALGWSGQWFAEFAHDGTGKTDITAGMEHLELKLLPGEEIRSPRVMLLYWQGTPLHSHNVFRQFVLKYHSPQINGQPVEMPICNGSWGGTPTQGHLDAIKAIAKHDLPYDYYWIDAGWYGTSSEPCPDVFHGDWATTGNWCVNRNYHPNGLKPISDAAHQVGMKFLLWIEPMRAKYGTPVTLEHPEWFLRSTKEEPKHNDDVLLNLGHSEAWQWVVETVSSLILENSIDCYRQDFNIDPYPCWENSDEDGRKGVIEMRFVEGLYAFWDELRRRHPNLLIDNCASGGRLLDLETIGRSVTLWRTDYNSFPSLNPEGSQLHGMGLNLWLPLTATSPFAKPGDTYQVRSAYSSGLVISIDEFGFADRNRPDFPWEWFHKRIYEAKRLRPYFYGDFYPLTPSIINPEVWMVYQVHLSNKQEGAVLAFHRSESRMTECRFQLYGLQASELYKFEDADSNKTWEVRGAELMSTGLEISLDAPCTSRLLFYKLFPQK